MAAQNELRQIWCLNLSAVNVQFRILADKTLIEESWTKDVNETYDRIKKEGSGEVGGGFEGFEVKLGGSGAKETETKEYEKREDYKKIVNQLVTAGFSTILPRRLKKISIESSSAINFVSIIVGGKLAEDNWNISDKEIYIDGDFTVGSNPEPKMAPYFEEGVLFSSAYIIGLQAILRNFQDLYFFGSTATIEKDGKEEKILSDETITELAVTALGFRGVNFASSKLLSIVKDRWINDSVKLLYDSGKKIETMQKKVVAALLYQIASQAEDISDAFAGAAQWYNQSQSEINQIQYNLLAENEKAQNEFGRYLEKKQKWLDKREDALKNHRNTMKWAIPVAFCNPAGLYTGIGTGIALGVQEHQLMDQVHDAEAAYEDALDEAAKVTEAFKKIKQLADGLGEMGTFCLLASSWFLDRKLEFSNWGEAREQKSEELKEDFKDWSSEQCVDFIVNLDEAYKKYRDVLLTNFNRRKIDGSKFGDKINANVLEDWLYEFDSAEVDSVIIEQRINALTQSSELAFIYVKEKFDESLAWIGKQNDEITKMLEVLNKVNTAFAFKKEDISPHKFAVIELKTFKVKISPEEEAKTLWQGI